MSEDNVPKDIEGPETPPPASPESKQRDACKSLQLISGHSGKNTKGSIQY